jgi:thiamine biosynthesis lipoprotein
MAIHTFRAMGTSWEVQGPDHHPAWARAVDAVIRRAAAEEARFSRFRADSELSNVNARTGTATTLSAPFASLLAFALEAARRTHGRFDPTVHDALVAAGYDRDFDEVLAGARGRLFPATPCGRWDEIRLDGRRVHLPRGVHLDLGGVAKGWTVDRAAEDALDAGLAWILVNAGGDLRVGGDAPGIDVRIEDPDDRTDLARLTIAAGGLATSCVTRRAWAPGEHHVIDPRTGAPADTSLRQATVWAPTAAEAEVLATWALLTGRAAAHDTHAVLVEASGDVVVSLPREVAA